MQNIKEKIKENLKNLGIKSGDTVLMHSSYKALGENRPDAKTFFEAFFEVLGEKGTLILPTLSYAYVTRDNPDFDYYETKSCVGYLSEYFRTEYPGTIRSMHATHSCAAGGCYAKEIVSGHEKDLTPVGENSPFAKLPKYNGKILMMGCLFGSNTSMHGVEETAEPPYCIDRINPVNYTLKKDDTVIKQVAWRHNFNTKDGVHIKQRYDRILELLEGDEVNYGNILEAKCCLMSAKAVWEKGHNKLLEEPLYFVDYPE